MLRKLLNSYFIYRLNKRYKFIDLYNFHKNENSFEKKWFKASLSFFKPRVKKSEGILLIQKVEDYEYTLKLAAASKAYAENKNLKVCTYSPYFTKDIGWIDPIKEKYQKNFKVNLDQLYESFGAKQIFDAHSKYSDQNKVLREFDRIKEFLLKPEDVLNIKIEGILVGDLIYDTYLRFFALSTIVEVKGNEQLMSIIKISINYFYSFTDFIKKTPVKSLFTTYTTYISHGIPVRICLEKNIPVYAFGIYTSIFKKIEREVPYHCASHWFFSGKREIPEEKLLLAKENLESRFSGKLDEAISYMRITSFSSKELDDSIYVDFTKNQRNVVIYIHDFYDSSHINRCLLFPDLFQFLKCTLDHVNNSEGTSYWIKIHPNWSGDCKERAIDLVESYNFHNFRVLDEFVSNHSIVALKPDLIVTARGTIAMEMAYFEIPVVALYDNPYVNFGFTHTCYDVDSFFEIVSGKKEPIIDFDKDELYSYYYQAFLEQLEDVDVGVYYKLQSYLGDRFKDDYISLIRENKKEIFNDSFIDNYRRKFERLENNAGN